MISFLRIKHKYKKYLKFSLLVYFSYVALIFQFNQTAISWITHIVVFIQNLKKNSIKIIVPHEKFSISHSTLTMNKTLLKLYDQNKKFHQREYFFFNKHKYYYFMNVCIRELYSNHLLFLLRLNILWNTIHDLSHSHTLCAITIYPRVKFIQLNRSFL